MAQHDYVIANQSGAAFRSDLNNALSAIVSQNSGSAQPSTTFAYQLWADTTTGLLKIRNAANNAWVTVGDLATTNLGLAALASPTFTGTVTAPTFTATTASTIPLGSATSPTLYFTGDSNTGIYSPGADQFAIATGGSVRISIASGDTTFSGNVLLSGTGYLDLPAGTTAQRPGSANSGMIRYNSDLSKFEGYTTAWGAIGGGATGGSSDDIFYENGQTVTANYTLTTNKNAMSAGPITINSGATVTVPTGASWVIV
jgi:hypothetical protein